MDEKKQSSISMLWGFAKPYHGQFILCIILAVLGVGCSMIVYFCIATIVSKLFLGNSDLNYYIKVCCYLVGGHLGKVVFANLSTTLSHRATYYTLRDLRKKLIKKLILVPMGNVIDTPSGEYKSIIVDRVENMEPTFAHLIPEMCSNILAPIAIFGYMLYLDWRMALASLITLIIGILVMMSGMKSYPIKWEGAVKAEKNMSNAVVEYIDGIEVVKVFSKSASSYKKFSNAVNYNAGYYVNWMRENLKTMSGYNAIFPSVLVAMLPLGFLFWSNGSLDAARLFTIIILSLGVVGPIMAIFTFIDDFAVLDKNVNEINSILNMTELKHSTSKVEIDNYEIRLKGVSFAYEGKKNVLKNINLTIKPGQVTALVGHSGSGKSTIGKLIAGFWDVKEGEILIGGINTTKIPLKQLSEIISYVSQDNFLFDKSIRENIRMGKLSATNEEIEAVCKSAGCHDFIQKLNLGYDTVAGSGGNQLSGGERQRIAIARAMLKNAPIIILDEATAFIDPENELAVQKAITTLTKGKTLIVIAHRLSTITNANNIVVLQQGRCIAQGKQDDLINNCTVYQKMWEAHINSRDSEEV